ncbi:hypothetical protein Taro_051448 [Colocasia esculenta]|uniref:Retrotransposon gag domain-containing protein n=1 Tax=Colocasia esculenta TaxID=4460 RepID=A0A843XGL3_COLES|nr:hypothetical protein [Colocasia esculenta]
MDRYFEWYEMTDSRRVRFAKMKLLGQAQTYWVNVESLLMQRYQHRIETWDDMKAKLREKYLPATYRQRLIDRWQSLTQGSRPASEYIAEFDEYLLRCGVHEESAMTLSRFRKGLRQTYQHELFKRNVTTLEYAYQVAQEVELFESEYQPPSHDCGLVSHHLGTNHYPYLPHLHAHRAPFLLPDRMTRGRVLQVASHLREVAHASSATVVVVLVTLKEPEKGLARNPAEKASSPPPSQLHRPRLCPEPPAHPNAVPTPPKIARLRLRRLPLAPVPPHPCPAFSRHAPASSNPTPR